MWPFTGRAVRASAEGERREAEARLEREQVEAEQRELSGLSLRPEHLALAEACVGIWSRSFASAVIEPADSVPLRAVTADCLALAGRALALTGDAVFAIEVMNASVMLRPASTWDPRGDYRQETRHYYLTLSGPQSTVRRNLPDAAVLHVSAGADPVQWWRGRPPLRRSRATADVAARLERRMQDYSRLPVGILFPQARPAVPGPGQTDPIMDSIRRGGITGIATGQASGLEQLPASRYAGQPYGPSPTEHALALRSQLGLEIANAFGCPAALFAEQGDGSGQREAARRLWNGTIVPLGMILEVELRRKLDPAAMVSFPPAKAIDEDVQSRAIARRAEAYRKLREGDDGMGEAEARRLAFGDD